MFAVIFEVNPKPEQWDTYLGYAKTVAPRTGADRRVPRQRALFQPAPDGLAFVAFDMAGREGGDPLAHLRPPSRNPAKGPDARFSATIICGSARSSPIAGFPTARALREQRFDETAGRGQTDRPCRRPRWTGCRRTRRRDGCRAARRARPSGIPGLVDWDVFESIVSTRQIHSPDLLARCGSCQGMAGSTACRRYPPSPRPGDPRLRDV